MIFADHLSRNIGAKQSVDPTCKGLDLKIQDIYLNTSNERCLSLAKETDKDETLIALKNVIIKGWPSMRSDCPHNLRKFWMFRDELSILNRLVLKGVSIVVPVQCQAEVLEKLHEGHFGIDRTKLRAKDTVYWPEINGDIEALIKSCEFCQEHGCRNSKDLVLARELPMVPWTLIEMDVFTHNDHSYLLIVDVTSRFPVVRNLTRETTKAIVTSLKHIYADFGLPKRVLSNNRPCFKAREYQEFHAKLGVMVEYSSAYNHQSVGSVERMAQTMKQILSKNGDDAWLAMLIYKTTSIPGIYKSPSEILSGRKYRTNLPIIDIQSKENEVEIKKLYQKRELSQKGKTLPELPSIPDGSKILYEKNPDSSKIKCPEWVKGTVKDKCQRKYQILSDSDKMITRSRHHIKGYQTCSGRLSKVPDHLNMN